LLLRELCRKIKSGNSTASFFHGRDVQFQRIYLDSNQRLSFLLLLHCARYGADIPYAARIFCPSFPSLATPIYPQTLVNSRAVDGLVGEIEAALSLARQPCAGPWKMRGTSEAPISFRPKDSAVTMLRKAVDPSALMMKSIEAKLLHGGTRPFVGPHSSYMRDTLAPFSNPTDVAALCATRLQGVGLSKHRASVNSVVFLPDKDRIWSASTAGDVSVYTSASLAFERMVPAHNAGIKVMRFNHGGTYMVSADVEGTIKYWDSSLTSVEDFRGHREAINGVE
jgi:hypothetical protein